MPQFVSQGGFGRAKPTKWDPWLVFLEALIKATN